MARGDFFSGSERRDERIAGGFQDYSIEDKKNVINFQKKKAKDPNYQPKSYELESLKRQTMPGGGLAFSPMSKEIGQFASASPNLSGMLASKQPLSPIGSDDYKKEVEGFIKDFKDDFMYRRDFDVDTGERIDRYGRPIPGERFGEEEMRRDYPYRRQFRYENWDGEKYTPGVPFGQKPKTEEEGNIFQRVGNFLANTFTGTQPVAAGTLDDAPKFAGEVSTTRDETDRPKLNYVNPDAKTMSLSQIADAFKPKNLFGYKDKFGRFDDPGSPLARDREQTMQRVAQNFTSPIVADARTIGQIRADQEARMRENARLRNESFQRGERVKQKSADVTYGTNMLSNPAFGFRDNMTDDAKAKYDQSARDATEMARTDPSLGNVIAQTVNRVTGLVGGPQMSLESIGERQLRLANKEINRPTYQKEAYARKMLGITNEQLKARNIQQIRANAYARNQAFQADKVQRGIEKTTGQGMPSNPKGFSGYSRKSSPGTSTSQSTSKGGISKSTSRGQGGGISSRSRGGVSRGGTKSNTGSKSSSRGTSGSRSRGGTGSGGTSTSRSASSASKSRTGRSRTRCDISTKIDISSLTNQNLVKDDLAKVAYFVQELREK